MKLHGTNLNNVGVFAFHVRNLQKIYDVLFKFWKQIFFTEDQIQNQFKTDSVLADIWRAQHDRIQWLALCACSRQEGRSNTCP